MSNAFAQGKGPQQLVSTPASKMAQSLGVTLLQQTRVQAIDAGRQVLATDRGPVTYRKLVLATGGLIGCEFANDLASAGFRVSVIDPAPRPLAALLPEAAGEALKQALQRLGTQWHLATTVQAVHKHAGSLQLRLANGITIDADAVLSAIGLRPNTDLAQAAGFACERGIVVDSALAASVAGVFALGDCAQYAGGSWSNAPVAGGRLLPYVMPIMSAAKVLAAQLAGRGGALTFPLMPVSIKTPALPIVVASPMLSSIGQWHAPEEGLWHFIDATGARQGFVLAGKQTSRRAEQAARLAV